MVKIKIKSLIHSEWKENLTLHSHIPILVMGQDDLYPVVSRTGTSQRGWLVKMTSAQRCVPQGQWPLASGEGLLAYSLWPLLALTSQSCGLWLMLLGLSWWLKNYIYWSHVCALATIFWLLWRCQFSSAKSICGLSGDGLHVDASLKPIHHLFLLYLYFLFVEHDIQRKNGRIKSKLKFIISKCKYIYVYIVVALLVLWLLKIALIACIYIHVLINYSRAYCIILI